MEVSDRVTVLRKGRYVGTVDTASTTQEELSRMTVSYTHLDVYKRQAMRCAAPRPAMFLSLWRLP